MKAARISEYGGPAVVTIEEIDKPALGSNQVLVEVYAASLNPFDTAIRSGSYKDTIPLDLPVTLGGDIAGVVIEIGEDAVGLAVGDHVFGQANVVAGNSGAFAEYATTAATQVAKAPDNLDLKQAAALPLVGVSALQGVTEHINLQSGQKIFIHGGAGGIGSLAILIAKHLGAYVATTATGDGVEFVRQLGADKVIDYKAQDFTDTLDGFDAVFDTVGGDDFSKSLSVLKRGGVAVSMIAPADEAKAEELGITAMTQATKVATAKLDALRKLVEDGIIVPQIDKTYPLAQIKEAFEAKEAGKVRGKIVIEIKQ